MVSTKGTLMENPLYKFVRYNVTPPLFVCFFTMVTQALVVIGNPDLEFDDKFLLRFYDGLFSIFAWKVVLITYTWAFISLVIPGKIFKGPSTPKAGYVPIYKANGAQYYIVSLLAYLGLVYSYPNLTVRVYNEFSAIVAVSSATSLLLCTYLLISGIFTADDDSDNDHSYFYLFYRGVHLHPRILNVVDVKQWTNCRVGMIGWALLTINFSIASCIMNGSVEKGLGSIVHALLTNIYLAKFFYWETGYFNTLDITLDRAGYYLCWGCLCFVQSFYTFTAYYMVKHPSHLSPLQLLVVFIYGSVSIFFNYYVDYQKEMFIASRGKCTIWGKQAKYLEVEYKTHSGVLKRSKLLTSGFWGVTRHMNYVFEISLAIAWSLPSLYHSGWPFAYVLFLTCLLIHRTFRDEEKCSAKYKKYWIEYCRTVPYRMIPGNVSFGLLAKMFSTTFMESSFYKFVRYDITPPLFVCFFTMVTQALVVIGNPDLEFDDKFMFRFYDGLFSIFAWKVVLIFYAWALLSLLIPGKIFPGSPTPKAGYVPLYKANGFQYYIISMVTYLSLIYCRPQLSVDIYNDFSAIIAILNLTALLLCIYLLISGLFSADEDSDNDHSYLYLFYRGVHLHPRIFNVDVKQWTNCRVGMLSWALLTLNFSIATCIINGSIEKGLGSIVHALLTNIYLAKFFYWETGYFNTLDMKMDRAGYYLCWGCLCFVQVFLAFTSYFMVNHTSDLSTNQLILIFIFGSVSIALNYAVDYQKETFVATNGKCNIWNKPAKYLKVEYRDYTGRVIESKLLISGFWGVSRHMNYVFEILFAISLCVPGLYHGVWPFLYLIFIATLLIHRTFRDDEKCSAKYKKYWIEYCRIVPYRMIPGIF